MEQNYKYLSKKKLTELCGIKEDKIAFAVDDLEKNGLIRTNSGDGAIQNLSRSRFDTAIAYAKKNAHIYNSMENCEGIDVPQVMEPSFEMKKEIGLLNGTILEIERLIAFKIGSISTREHLMKLVQGLMVTSIAVGVDAVHEKIDKIIIDNITNNFGTRGS